MGARILRLKLYIVLSFQLCKSLHNQAVELNQRKEALKLNTNKFKLYQFDNIIIQERIISSNF